MALPLWAPVVGGLAGLAALGGGGVLALSQLRKRDIKEAARLQAQVMTVVLVGPHGDLSHTLVMQLRDKAASMGLEQEWLEGVLLASPRSPDGLGPCSADDEVIDAVLEEVWFTATAQGLSEDERLELRFERVAARLGAEDRVGALKQSAEQKVDQQSSKVCAALDLARAAIPNPNSDAAVAALKALARMDPAGNAEQRLETTKRVGTTVVAAGAALAAHLGGASAALPVIGQAYVTALGAVKSPEERASVRASLENAAQAAGASHKQADRVFEAVEDFALQQLKAAGVQKSGR